MPLYDYHCPHCKKTSEVAHKVEDTPPDVCPRCHKKGLERLFSSHVGVHFKGSGFYETDYKKEKPSKSCCGGSCSCPHNTQSKET